LAALIVGAAVQQIARLRGKRINGIRLADQPAWRDNHPPAEQVKGLISR
jgi:hypothetical protein